MEDLIGVHYDGLQTKRGATFRAALDFLGSAQESGDWVASARRQGHDLKMDVMSLIAQQLVQQLPIGLFGFTLAAQEHRNALENGRTARFHPIWGTAP